VAIIGATDNHLGQHRYSGAFERHDIKNQEEFALGTKRTILQTAMPSTFHSERWEVRE
jgi:hypothetical protein